MRKKDFLYFLLNEQGEPLIGNLSTGQVYAGSKDTLLGPNGEYGFLRKSPDGWRDVLVKYGRNQKYMGMFRDFTVPMRFPKDGALILRWLFWKYGIEAYAKLLIVKNDRTIWPEKHKTWYVGEIDFSKFKQDKYGNVTVNVMEGGLSKLLKAHENTKYEIPIDDDPEHVYVKEDGVELTEKSNFSMIDGLEIAKTIWGSNILAPINFINREGRSTGITFSSQNIEDVTSISYDDKLKLVNWFANASLDNALAIDVNISGKIKFTCTQNDPGLGFRMRFLRSNLPITNQNDYEIFSLNPIVGNTYEFPVNITLPLQPGERAYFEQIYFGGAGVDIKIQFLQGSDLSMTYKSRFKTTYVKGLYAYRVGQKLVEKITNGQYTLKSDLLNSRKDIILTSGNGIRGIEGAVIKTSLTDFFKFCFILDDTTKSGAGLGIENDKVVIERLSYFFKNTSTPTPPPLELGTIDLENIAAAEDLFFNTIKVGYPNQEYDDVNGKYEVNVTHTYSTPGTRIVKELDLVCPYRADSIGMELLRINYENLDTTDKKDDNEVFILNTETALNPGDTEIPQHYNLYRPAFTSITGLPAGMAATIFNVMLSPKRVLLNNGAFIRSINHRNEAGKLVFESGDKNSELSTTLAGETITENEDVEISQLQAVLFLPYYVQLTTSVVLNLQEYMTLKPYETIGFIHKGVSYYTFLWDGGIKPATNDHQQWKMIFAPNNDLEKLITKV